MIILSATTYDDESTVIGDRFKGDGYYGSNDGLHTVAWKITNFVGTIKIQGSLASTPTANDWFDIELGGSTELSIDTTGKASLNNISSVTYTSATTKNSTYNFVGNYVWVRAVIENFSAGTVNSIHMNN